MNGAMAELAENKLRILYFMDALDIPLTNSQITQFFLEKYLIEYIDLQQLIAELIQTEHLCHIEGKNSQYIGITEIGKETLNMFVNKVNINIRRLIDTYATENKQRLKNESQLKASYTRLNKYQYIVTMKALEADEPLVEIKLNVVSKDQAKSICDSWKSKAPEVYKKIIETLIN